MKGNVDELMGQVVEAQDPGQQARVLSLLAIDAATLVADELPPVAQFALERAKEYWNGALSVHELTEVRVKAWDSLDDACDFASREVNIVRLVICSLYPTVERGQEDLACEAAIGFARAVGTPEEMIRRSLQRHIDSTLSE